MSRPHSRAESPPASAAASSAGADLPRANAARALRVLAVSGRRLIQCGGVWRVFPKGDRRLRAVLQLTQQEVERLKADKLIVPAASGGYVLAPDNQVEARDPDAQPAAGPWIFNAAGVAASNLAGPGFAGMALRAQLGEGPLTLRQAAAGVRLVEDVEQAARNPSLTMNWDAAPADKTRRSGVSGGRIHPARRAQLRIDKVKSALGEGAFALVYSACIRRLPTRELERRHGLARRAGHKALAAALETVAEIYDG